MQGRFSSTDHGLFFLLFFCLFPVLHLYFGLSSVLYFFCFLNYFVGWWVVWELKVTKLPGLVGEEIVPCFARYA